MNSVVCLLVWKIPVATKQLIWIKIFHRFCQWLQMLYQGLCYNKPLTNLLKGKSERIRKYCSKNIPVPFNEIQMSAFDKLRNSLASEDVVLHCPNYSKPFAFTTDPLTMNILLNILLKNRKINYATNESELLAIVWAVDSLRHYLYGNNDKRIYTDQQPFILAVLDRTLISK